MNDTALQNLTALLANEFVQLIVAVASGPTASAPRIVGTLLLLIVPNLTHSSRPWVQIENVVDHRHLLEPKRQCTIIHTHSARLFLFSLLY